MLGVLLLIGMAIMILGGLVNGLRALALRAPRHESYVRIYQAASLIDAHLRIARLREAGINAELNGLRGICVPPAEAERARAILMAI